VRAGRETGRAAVPSPAEVLDHGRSRGIVTSSRTSTAATVTMARTNSGVRTIDSRMTVPENSAAHRYMISTLVRCE
jgi:hypothetical protein